MFMNLPRSALGFFALLAGAMVLPCTTVSAQTVINTFPYSQPFDWVTTATSAFPATGDGSEFTTTATWLTGANPNITSGGIAHGGGGRLRLQGSGTAPNVNPGIVWSGNFTMRGSGTLTINYAKVANTPPATNPRGNELRIATNGGSGATFTDLALTAVSGGAWPLLSNTATAESGTLNVTLPSSLDNSADARVRIYFADSTGAGTRPRVDIDNLGITVSTTPVELIRYSVD